MSTMRWQDWVNLVLGAYLAASPWGLGFSHHDFATWNAVVLGLAIIVISLIDIDAPASWEEWVNLVLGLWLVVSPLALGFQNEVTPAWSTIIVGILVAMFAAWAMSLDKEIQKWWHEHVTGH